MTSGPASSPSFKSVSTEHPARFSDASFFATATRAFVKNAITTRSELPPRSHRTLSSRLTTVSLEAGTYAAACFFPTAGTGEPHAMKGMHTVFTVS